MPEIAEVETVRRHIEKVLKGQHIAKVWIDAADHLTFDQDQARQVKKALLGARVTGTGRRGKYFWLHLAGRPSVVIHLGMSGNVEIWSPQGFAKVWGGVKLWSQKARVPQNSEVPRYCRLMLSTRTGRHVAVVDPRRFGRIRLSRNPLQEGPVAKLGFDPLEKFASLAELQKIFAGRSRPIKALLLDQSFFAGIGNWLADEILFQARISPHRRARDLSMADIKVLRHKILSIVRIAVRVNADYERFPKFWLFHDRWGKGRGEAYHSHGYEIKHDTIGGRTAAWVPALQV